MRALLRGLRKGRWCPLLAVLALTGMGCAEHVLNGGPVECGGFQMAFASAVLPDTGLGAGTQVQVALVQSDPHFSAEDSEFDIVHVWPTSRGSNPDLDPRVRLVRDDGQVLLDTVSTRFVANQPPGGGDRASWVVFLRLKIAAWRIALFEAMRDQTLSLELWRPGTSAPATRVRLALTSAIVRPLTLCY